MPSSTRRATIPSGKQEGGRPFSGSGTFRLHARGSYGLSVTGANIELQLLPIELKAKETLSIEIDLR